MSAKECTSAENQGAMQGQAERPPRWIALCVESSHILDRENAYHTQAGTVALKSVLH